MHEFESLIEQIENCNLSSTRKDRVVFQHLSVQQKLSSLDHYKEELLSFESSSFIDAVDLSSSSSSAVSTSPGQQPLRSRSVAFELNRILDAFVTNGRSVFDTLAREMEWLYAGSPKGDIYFSKWPSEKLQKRYLSSSFWKIVDAVKQEQWYQYLGVVRKSTIHECLISPRIRFELDPISGTVPISSIFLPDDPKVWPASYDQQHDLKRFVQETHQKITKFLEEVAITVRNDLPKIA